MPATTTDGPIKYVSSLHPSRCWSWLLGFSLVVNTGLAAWLWKARHPAEVDRQSPAVLRTELATPARELLSSTDASPAVVTHVLPFRWALLESTNYATYVANLRAVGCPEPVLHDLIAEELEDLYRHRQPPLVERAGFWVHGDNRRALERAQRSARLALEQEQRAVFRALLGDDWPLREDSDLEIQVVLSLGLDFLPEDRLAEAAALGQRLDSESSAVRDEADHLLVREDQERLLAIYRAWVAEISSKAGPMALEELRLRAVILEDGPRHDLIRDIPMTGAELRDFYRILTQDVDPMLLAFAREHNLSEITQAAPEMAEDPVRLEAIKTLLGPERAAAVERNRDPDFGPIRDFARRHQLPAELGVRLYESRKLAEATALQVRADASLSVEERQEQLREVAAAAELAARAVLPTPALTNYLHQQEAWHRQLTEGAP